jgi:hypothetical protein
MTTGKVEFVTHCYATELNHYATALYLQLSSLANHATNVSNIKATVFYNEEDTQTVHVLKLFEDDRRRKNLELVKQHLPVNQLGRRSIGRNMAARNTDADIVWFTDVDYWFGPVLVDNLLSIQWNDETTMLFPKKIQINKTHEVGDKILKYFGSILTPDPQNRPPFTPHMQVRDYDEKVYRKAIGGVQIVRGVFAREYGYVPDSKWQKPVQIPFGDFRDDIAYRSFCRSVGTIVPVDLDGVFRIRHSETSYQ